MSATAGDIQFKITADQAQAVGALIDLAEKISTVEEQLAATETESQRLETEWNQVGSQADHLGLQIATATAELKRMEAEGISKSHADYRALAGEIENNKAALQRLMPEVAAAERAYAGAQGQVNKLHNTLFGLNQTAAGQREALATAGIDVGNLAREYDRLAAEVEKAATVRKSYDTLGIKPFEDEQTAILKIQEALRTLQESGTASQKSIAAATEAAAAKIAELDGSAVKAAAALQKEKEAAQALDTALRELKVQPIEAQDAAVRRVVQAFETLRDSGRLTENEIASAADTAREKIGAMSSQSTAAAKAMNDLAKEAAQARGSVAQFDAAETGIQGIGTAATRSATEVRQLSEAENQAAASSVHLENSLAAAVRSALGFVAAYAGVQQALGIGGDVLKVGGEFEQLDIALTNMSHSSAAARQQFEWIKQFTRDTPLELDGTTEAFRTLKNFGLDPMDGSLQAIADQTANAGGSQEKMERIVLAVGQAWAKQKLQGEEILQLIEAGVPVWELLAAATGKTAAQLQDMSQKGQLGRDVIKALLDEMGRTNAGAAAAQMETFNGAVSNAHDAWTQFLALIADSGALDYFKGEIKAINAAVEEMARTGELKQWAQEASSAIVSISEAIKTGVVFIKDHAQALKSLAEIAIALKLGQVATQILDIGKAAASAKLSLDAFSAVSGKLGLAQLGLAGAAYSVGTAIGDLINKGIEWISNGRSIGTIIYDLTHQNEGAAAALEKHTAAQVTHTAATATATTATADATAKRQEANARLIEAAEAQDLVADATQKIIASNQNLATAEESRKDRLVGLIEQIRNLDQGQSENVATLEKLNKAVDDYGKSSTAEYAAKQRQIESERAYAEATGDTVAALQLLGEKQALTVQQAAEDLQVKQAQADIAEKLAAAKEKEAKAATNNKDQLEADAVAARQNATATKAAAVAADEHYAALIKLPPALGDVAKSHVLTAQDIDQFKAAAASAIATAHQQEQAYANGNISLRQLAEAQGQAAGALNTYTAALKAQNEQLQTQSAAISREAGLDRQRITNKLEAVRAAEQAAKAAGNETEATRLGIEVKRLEAQQEQISASEKAQLAEAAAQLAANLQAQAEADGVVTAAELASIQAAKDNAEAKKLEAEQSRIAASAKRAEADATQQEANTKKSAKTATDAAKTSQDSLNQSQNASVQILTGSEKALAAYTQAVNEFGNLDLGLKIANESIAQKVRLESLKASLDSAANSGEALGDAMRKAGLSSDLSGVSVEDLRRRFDWLDDADLSNLLSSVDSVRSAVASLRDGLASTVSTLQDELDSLTGNERAKAEREYQTKKAELDSAYQEAVNARDAQSQNSALQALKLLDEIHTRKVAAFQEEEQAAKSAKRTSEEQQSVPSNLRSFPESTPDRRQSPEPSTPAPTASRTIRLDLRTDAGQLDAWTDNRGADVLDRIGRAQRSTRRGAA